MSEERLPYWQNTKKEDEVSTTVREPKYTTKTERTVSGFMNPDGTPNTAAEEDFNRHYRDPYAQANGIDPETGKVDRNYITDILHVDPEVMRRKREEEAALNRSKQKEAGLYNALSVLGDMMTTAAGGNVWKRTPDGKAAEARKRNLQLEQEQQAEDIANAKALRDAELSYATGIQKMRDAYAKSFGLTQSQTTETGGNSVTTRTGGNSQTTGSRTVISKDGKKGDKKIVKYRANDGMIYETELDNEQFKAVTNLLKSRYDRFMHDENNEENAEDLRNRLIAAGVLKKRVNEMTGQNQYEYDEDMLLQNGNFWILDEGLREEIEKASGGKIRFVTGGRGTSAASAAGNGGAGRLSRVQSSDRTASR